MCYVIPIFRAILLRQGMKKARLPTQAPLWVNRRTMFYSQILCEKAQKAPCFWHFMSLNVFSPIITASSAAIQKGLINSRRAGLPAQGFQQSFNIIGKVQPDIHAPVRLDGDGVQQLD